MSLKSVNSPQSSFILVESLLYVKSIIIKVVLVSQSVAKISALFHYFVINKIKVTVFEAKTPILSFCMFSKLSLIIFALAIIYIYWTINQ